MEITSDHLFSDDSPEESDTSSSDDSSNPTDSSEPISNPSDSSDYSRDHSESGGSSCINRRSVASAARGSTRTLAQVSPDKGYEDTLHALFVDTALVLNQKLNERKRMVQRQAVVRGLPVSRSWRAVC
jgi:hypothetical protein